MQEYIKTKGESGIYTKRKSITEIFRAQSDRLELLGCKIPKDVGGCIEYSKISFNREELILLEAQMKSQMRSDLLYPITKITQKDEEI